MTAPAAIRRTDDLPREDFSAYLAPTPFIESSHPDVVAFARAAVGDAATDIEKGIRLFYAARDAIRYDPYNFIMTPDFFRASTTLRNKASFCIPKAVLLATIARAVGIPSAVGFADVRNHLTTERLRKLMDGADIFIWHGYAALYLDGAWVKATPAFNIELCEKFGVKPLEFDGRHDAMMHEFDAAGRRHMEYVKEHGMFADLPFQAIIDDMNATYPKLVREDFQPVGGDFESETRLN